jgi:hypothetical protein
MFSGPVAAAAQSNTENEWRMNRGQREDAEQRMNRGSIEDNGRIQNRE